MAALTEKDLEPVATLLAAGDVPKAANALGPLLGVATGHPVLGAVGGAAAEWFLKALTNTGTRRFEDAKKEYEDAHAKSAAFQLLLRSTLAPYFEAGTSRTAERMDELFLQTMRVMRRDIASAAGLEELQGTGQTILGKLELMLGSPPKVRLRMRQLLAGHALFAGRDSEMEKLDGFLTDSSGYCLVTGPSGTGKSALLATWIERALARDGLVVAYHFISRQHDLASQEDTLRSLVYQLEAGLGPTGWPKASLGDLRDAYLGLLESPSRPVLLLVDGVDEALDWDPKSLFPQLPANVHVVVSARTDGGDWSERLQIPIALTFELESLSTDGIGQLLAKAEAPSWTHAPSIIAKLEKVAGGDTFYLRQLIADVLPRHGLPARISSPSQLDAQPSGLTAYLEEWWKDVAKALRGDAALKQLLGYLVVAKGPLRVDDLKELGPSDLLDWATTEGVIDQLRRYLVGDPETGYRLCHYRFYDFLRTTKIKDPDRKGYRERVLLWCEGWRQSDSTYPVRYYVDHLLEGEPIDATLSQLSELLLDPEYQDARAGRAQDPAGLRADLMRTVVGLAKRQDAAQRQPLILCAREVEAIERQWLDSSSVFGLAKGGRRTEADRLLEILVSDASWRTVGRLIVAWHSSASSPDEAREGLVEIKRHLDGSPLLELLLTRVECALKDRPPQPFSLPYQPGSLPQGIPEQVASGLLTRLSGSLEMEGQLSGFSEALRVKGGYGEEAPAYIAEGDAPLLIAYAIASPADGIKKVEDYIQIHAANPYADYRNRSLWGVLGAVLCHPDDATALDLATHCVMGALAKSPIRFSEATAIAVLAQRGKVDQTQAAIFDAAVQDAVDAAQDATQPPDRWAFTVRRLSTFAEALAYLGGTGRALSLLDLAVSMTPGFAGFEAPASLTLADACFVVESADPSRRQAATDRAHRLVHNIQDPTFCARSTARFNALTEEFDPRNLIDIRVLIEDATALPADPRFAPRHRVGDYFDYRRPSDERISIDELRTASTLHDLAAKVFHCPAAKLLALNPELGPATDTQLTPGARIAVPDDGFTPVLAAHLSAVVVGRHDIGPDERGALLRKLVPLAASDPVALDAVLARLVLSLDRPDSAVLAELASRFPLLPSSRAVGYLPTPRVY